MIHQTSPTFPGLVQEFFTNYMVQQRTLSPRTVSEMLGLRLVGARCDVPLVDRAALPAIDPETMNLKPFALRYRSAALGFDTSARTEIQVEQCQLNSYQGRQ